MVPNPSRLIRSALRLAPTDAGAPPDTELLQRYAVARDEAAFAELVRRNGPVVLRACRNALGEAGADDAFQATFLLLARSAGRLARPGSLAGWLHAAAVRVARAARRADERRRRREATPRPRPAEADDLSWREVREILDTEIAALPARYRLPVVLCCVQEMGYEDAAREVGCPVGALRGRLERARDRLRRRLARYGLPLVAPVLIGASPPLADAAAIDRVVALVRAAEGGTVPPAVAALIRAAGRPKATLLLVPVAAVLVAVGLVAAAAALQAPVPAAPPTTKQPEAPAARAGDHFGDPLPAGAVARLGTRRLSGGWEPEGVTLSPDGTKVATWNYRGLTAWDAATGRPLADRQDYYVVAADAAGWRSDGVGVAVVRLADRSYFVSAFTDAGETRPSPPPDPNGVSPGPDVDCLALSPDATRLAVVRGPNEKQFTIDLLPATTGRPVSDLKPERTLGPFPGPCREVRYTAGGRLVTLHGPPEGAGDWSVALIDPGRNAVARSARIPAPRCGRSRSRYLVSLSADARLAAVAPRTARAAWEGDDTVRVWDLEAGREIKSVPFPRVGYESAYAFTPDGKSLVVANGDPFFRIWDLATGAERLHSPLPPGAEAPAVAVSSDGARFATARRDGLVDVWDTATGRPVVQLVTHRAMVASVGVSPDSRLVATLGLDQIVRVWETETGRPGNAIPAPGDESPWQLESKQRAVFTPDGGGVLFTAGGRLALADPLTGRPRDLPGALRGKERYVGGFSADGKSLATHADGVVTVWDWPAGTARVTITVPLGPGRPAPGEGPERVRLDYAPRLSPDGGLLFTNSVRAGNNGGYQNANDVWDARTGKLLHRSLHPPYPPAAFSPDGRVLYLGGHSIDEARGPRVRADALTAWDPAAGKLLRRFTEPDRPRGQTLRDMGWRVVALAVSPDGRLLAAAEWLKRDGVWVYDAQTGRPLKRFVGHVDQVTDLAFTPDGRRLVSVSRDQTGLVWDVSGVSPEVAPGDE